MPQEPAPLKGSNQPDFDDLVARLRPGIEIAAPIVLGCIEIARAIELSLRILTEQAMPYLQTLARID